jgi:hypothetical protein
VKERSVLQPGQATARVFAILFWAAFVIMVITALSPDFNAQVSGRARVWYYGTAVLALAAAISLTLRGFSKQ